MKRGKADNLHCLLGGMESLPGSATKSRDYDWGFSVAEPVRSLQSRALIKGGLSMKMIIAALVLTATIGGAFAHSGGTDANGCHAGTRIYHCH